MRRRAVQRRERRVERLQRVEAGRQHGLDLAAPGSSAASRRAVISISGSSGTTVHVSLPRGGSVDQGGGGGDRQTRAARARGAGGACPRRAATCTGRTSAPRCAPRSRPARRRSSACRAPRPATPRTWSRASTAPGRGRCCCVGHVDTVVAHAQHRPLERVGEQLLGSGSVDMKGGDILAIGALRAFADAPGALRADRAAARLRRGVADRRLLPRRALRGVRRLPVLRGGRARRRGRGRGRAPQGGGHDPHHGQGPQRPLGLARRTGAATRCSRSPPPRRPSRRSTTLRVPTTSAPCRPSSAPGTPSTSSPAPASSSATCARTTSTRSSASSTTSRPRSAARRCTPS